MVIVASNKKLEIGKMFCPNEMIVEDKQIKPISVMIGREATKEEYIQSCVEDFDKIPPEETTWLNNFYFYEVAD